jgi:hypothetical protein
MAFADFLKLPKARHFSDIPHALTNVRYRG